MYEVYGLLILSEFIHLSKVKMFKQSYSHSSQIRDDLLNWQERIWTLWSNIYILNVNQSERPNIYER